MSSRKQQGHQLYSGPSAESDQTRQTQRAKKSLGQHFLAAPGVCRRICALLEPEPSDIILEIGPGRGALTVELQAAPHRLLILLEKDRELARERMQTGTPKTVTILTDACTFAWQGLGVLTTNANTPAGPSAPADQMDKAKFEDLSGTGVAAATVTTSFTPDPQCLETSAVCGTAKTADLPDPGVAGHSLKIVGNLPYNVGSRLIWDIVSQAPMQVAAFMVQKEVAQRLTADPGNGHYGMLSVWVQAYTRSSLEFVVPPGMFRPPPKVDSAVVLLRPRPASQHPACPQALARLLQIAFQKRRKQIGGIFRETKLPSLLEALEKLGLEPQLRPEDLTVEDFCRLAEICSQSLAGGSRRTGN